MRENDDKNDGPIEKKMFLTLSSYLTLYLQVLWVSSATWVYHMQKVYIVIFVKEDLLNPSAIRLHG